MLCFFGWTLTAQAAIPTSEREVLTRLYASTNGAWWFNNSGWNGVAGTECEWHGISCDRTKSHVSIVDLHKNGLSGSLPALGGLTELTFFDASYNQLTGSIPVLAGLTKLVSFSVAQNQLTGPIPALSGLTSLHYFLVEHNQLTSIPALSGLTALAYFYASDNQLSGSIPALDGLLALKDFAVRDNQLTGAIPALAGLPALRNFDAEQNRLSGAIPTLNGLTGLRYFFVSHNRLTGKIPSLAGLSALELFFADSNDLTGSIPSLDGLGSLRSFSTHHNRLSGSIPALASLAALQGFIVSNNQLTGPVPAAPPSLLAGHSSLCTNRLAASGDSAIDAAWVTATGSHWLTCQTAVIPTPSNYLLTATHFGAGTGGIASYPSGIDCGSTCSGSFAGDTLVTLAATPTTGSAFAGWSGACSGTGPCNLTIDAAKTVTATFNPAPFVAVITKVIAASSAIIGSRITFNASDIGGTGSVFVTALVPEAAVGSVLGTATAERTGASADSFVLVQLTSTGWRQVMNGRLIPYASGVFGDPLSQQTILDYTSTTNLKGAQFCIGYGSSATEMIAAGRMLLLATIPDANSTRTATGSCLITAQTGWWWNPAERGRGFFLETSSGTAFLASYLYAGNGRATWYASSMQQSAGAFPGTLDAFRSGQSLTGAYRAPAAAIGSGGNAKITLTDSTHATLDWAGGSTPIERLVFADNSNPPAFQPQPGWWWYPSESGRGFSIEVQGSSLFLAGYMYDAAGDPIWYLSIGTLSGQSYQGTWTQYADGQTLGGAYVRPRAANSAVGRIAIEFSSAIAGVLTLPDGRQIPIERFRF